MSDKKKKLVTVIAVITLAVLLIVVAMILRNKNKLENPVKNTTIGMGTIVEQTFFSTDKATAKKAVTDTTDIINKLDVSRLSWREKGSDVWNINSEHSAYVDTSTFQCIEQCFDVSSKCDGVFDITVGKLSTLWNIGTEDARVPSDEEIDEALPTINYKRIVLLPDDKGSYLVETGEDQMLDLGAVGKGLACDRIRLYLETTDIKGAIVSVGGSVLAYGKNPVYKDGTWNIGIRDPFMNDGRIMGILNCEPCCVSTSGDYEKVLEADGKKYHHILDPRTGYPAVSNVTSVTVIAQSGTITDALSTACFILGYSDASLELLKEYDAEAIFIDKEGRVYLTPGVEGKLTITSGAFTIIKDES
jgi:thiamine biosynthesis lipoprotein